MRLFETSREDSRRTTLTQLSFL